MFHIIYSLERASPRGMVVKNLPVMQENWVWSPGGKDPLEKEMATHSSFHAWRIPWTAEPDRLQSVGLQESDMTQWLYYYYYSLETMN